MRHLKILAVALLLSVTAMMSFLASPSSATTLEDSNGNHPTTIDLSLVGSAVVSSGSTVIGTCTGGTFESISVNTGSETETVRGMVSAEDLTWSGCTKTTHTLEGGELEIHHLAGNGNGTVRGAGFKWTTFTLGVSCVYGLSTGGKVHFGTLTGSATTAVLHVDTIVIKREGSFLCPSSAEWEASYHVTTPSGLTVTAG